MHLRAFGVVLFAFSSTLIFSGCGDEHDHGDEHSTVEEACGHAVEGPFQSVTATADKANAPSATFAHTAVNIALVEDPDNAGSYVGNVTYAADEATEFVFFLSSDVTFAIYDASDNEVEIEASADVTECTEVAKEHKADLAVGTYTLWFGQTTETSVTLVVEEASHESHDDEHGDH